MRIEKIQTPVSCELVPTEAELARREGREYEPAAALLERVRGEGRGVRDEGRGAGRTRLRRGKQPQQRAVARDENPGHSKKPGF
jgi:hypothetical protein